MTERLQFYKAEKCGNIVEVLHRAGDKAYRRFLNPGEAPEATFALQADKVTARAYCNLHGLWKG
jgi:superoxide reductase